MLFLLFVLAINCFNDIQGIEIRAYSDSSCKKVYGSGKLEMNGPTISWYKMNTCFSSDATSYSKKYILNATQQKIMEVIYNDRNCTGGIDYVEELTSFSGECTYNDDRILYEKVTQKDELEKYEKIGSKKLYSIFDWNNLDCNEDITIAQFYMLDVCWDTSSSFFDTSSEKTKCDKGGVTKYEYDNNKYCLIKAETSTHVNDKCEKDIYAIAGRTYHC